MRKSLLLPCAMIISLVLAHGAFAFGGPLQVKNQFPLFVTLDAPFLETASYDHALSVGLSYSSVYMVRNSPSWSVNLDMEVAEINFRYRKTILDLVELGIEVPLLSFNSGFMDDFLSGYHKLFGFSDYGRSSRPRNSFLYEVRKNGVIVIQGEGGGIGIGDIRLSAKRVLLDGDPVVSIKADVELPTGSASRGYGNGSVDGGASLLIDKSISEKVKTYLNLGVVFPGDLRAHETIRLKEFLYGGVCIEAALWEGLSLLGQATAQGSPFPKTGIGSMDRTSVLFTLGGRYYAGKNSFELSVTEDPNTAGAPDFTVAVTFKRRF